MKRPAIFLVLAVLALGLLGVSSAATLPLAGNLDRSFGKGGVLTQSGIGIGAIAVQPDGKIVVAGGAASAPSFAGFALARYLPNGLPDLSFGNGGVVETNLYPPASYAGIDAIALQADGKIVVAGTSDGLENQNVLHQFTLARYNSDGSLDKSFGTDGITNTVIPEPVPQGVTRWSVAGALAVLPNGEILAGGTAGWTAFPDQSFFALVRYTPVGSLDPTFGAGGIVQTEFSGYDGLDGIVIQPDGKIVASGGSSGGGHGNDWDSMALARYESDGSLDPSFGRAGKVTTAHKLGYSGGPSSLQHGKIIVAGFAASNHPVIARYEPSGRPDPTFGKHGFAEFKNLPGDTAILTQHDGKLLIATGHSVVRLLPNGRLDPNFGKRGIVSLSGSVQATRLALQPDQKVLAEGESGGLSALARLIGGNNCVVPGLRGITVKRATAALKKSYCRRGRISRRFSSKVTRGRVISATPRRGTRLPGGTKVDLVVSAGKRA